jgi:hypothetical protein
VTYPLATTMLSVPGAKTVRGYSFFGDSFVYVLFEDGTDLYWARSRVLEYLSQYKVACRPAPSRRWGRMRRGWLDFPVRAGRSQWRTRSGAAARTSGLVPQVRTQDPAQRCGSGHRGWHGQAVPGAA